MNNIQFRQSNNVFLGYRIYLQKYICQNWRLETGWNDAYARFIFLRV